MDHNKVINQLKGLIINGVNRAQSGHPGGALSSLDFAYILYTEFLNFDPDDPSWLGRDRFVLSAGHESMLLYSLLMGVGWLSLDDLKGFRQLNSKTPGHPEVHLTPGVECTTGPLGQGAAMSVGFSMASLHLQASLDKDLFSNRIWALLGDGCMQEDVTLGAASLAGHQKLGNLIWYYDRNEKQISGDISRACSDDYEKIFKGFGWQVITIDAHNHEQIRDTLGKITKNYDNKCPQLIIANSTMAKGLANLEGDHSTHGAPLSQSERMQSLKKLGLSSSDELIWPQDINEYFQRNFPTLRKKVQAWKKSFTHKIREDNKFQTLYKQYFETHESIDFPHLLNWKPGDQIATRNSFGIVLENLAHKYPNLMGGSADLEPSNMTGAFAKTVGDFNPQNRKARNIAYGVREFTMSAVSNGLALYGGIIPFDATFLVFSDYSRAAIRLGALQEAKVIHEFSHDSFYVGEDGPTHQAVEHLMSLRAIPNLYVFRPCDAVETEMCIKKAIELKKPSCLCLTRQKVPNLAQSIDNINEISKGAWIIKDSAQCDMIIFASGSEVHLALSLCELIEKRQKVAKSVKVVSVNCWELFFEQEESYINKILSPNCQKRMSIEAGITAAWEKFVGHKGLAIGINEFGMSAPSEHLAEKLGFTPEKLYERSEVYFCENRF